MRNFIFVSFLLLVFFSAIFIYGCATQSKPYSFKLAVKEPVIAEAGKKVPIGAGYYFIFNFADKPSLGINILKVQIFDVDGNKNASFEVRGTADMSGMRGMGGSEHIFKRNKKNDYLSPFDVTMRGDWEMVLTFYLGKTEYAKAKINFDL